MTFVGKHTNGGEDRLVNALGDPQVTEMVTRLDDGIEELTIATRGMAWNIEGLDGQVAELSRKLATAEAELAACREINQRIQT